MSESLSESSCVYCDENDDHEMVQCDVCDGWAHYLCARVGPEIEFLPWSCCRCRVKSNGHHLNEASATKVDACVGTESTGVLNEALPSINENRPTDISVDLSDQREPHEQVPVPEDAFDGWDKLLKNRNAFTSMKLSYLAINLNDMKQFIKDCIVKTFAKEFIQKINFETGSSFNESNILSCLIETVQEKFKEANLDNKAARKEIIAAFRRFRDAKSKSNKKT